MDKTRPYYKIAPYLSDKQTFIMSNKSSKLQKTYIQRKRNMNQNGEKKGSKNQRYRKKERKMAKMVYKTKQEITS